YGLQLATKPPQVPYHETIRKGASVRGRHKRQTGGHGQFGDVVIEIAPSPRGGGFAFHDRIKGGVVPKQWIPSVEKGVREYMKSGPLGFPVVDINVALDRKSTRLNSSHPSISYAVFCLKKKILRVDGDDTKSAGCETRRVLVVARAIQEYTSPRSALGSAYTCTDTRRSLFFFFK